jgi:hypothetical protein
MKLVRFAVGFRHFIGAESAGKRRKRAFISAETASQQREGVSA